MTHLSPIPVCQFRLVVLLCRHKATQNDDGHDIFLALPCRQQAMTPYRPRTLTAPRSSFFLFGPRGTGKTTWVRHEYPDAHRIDLLDEALYQSYLADVGRFAGELQAVASGGWVFVDEIQRLPSLLNEVHRHIEDSGLRFILTGSSARKLKRAGVNLLGGSAVHTRMYPFLAHELGTDFDLDTVLRHGSLPVIWNADDRASALRSYVQLYLKGRDQGRSAGTEPGWLRALHAGRRPVSRADLEHRLCRARCRGQPDHVGRLRGDPGGHAGGVPAARVRSEAARPGTEAPEAVLDRSRNGAGGGRTLPRSRPA